jgi:hypothetical protein
LDSNQKEPLYPSLDPFASFRLWATPILTAGKKRPDERYESELLSIPDDVPAMRKGVTETAPNVPLEKTYYIVVISRQCANEEIAICRCHQQERVVETKLPNLNNVGWQDLAILATAPAK